jgi:hypothetical protein
VARAPRETQLPLLLLCFCSLCDQVCVAVLSVAKSKHHGAPHVKCEALPDKAACAAAWHQVPSRIKRCSMIAFAASLLWQPPGAHLSSTNTLAPLATSCDAAARPPMPLPMITAHKRHNRGHTRGWGCASLRTHQHHRAHLQRPGYRCAAALGRQGMQSCLPQWQAAAKSCAEVVSWQSLVGLQMRTPA